MGAHLAVSVRPGKRKKQKRKRDQVGDQDWQVSFEHDTSTWEIGFSVDPESYCSWLHWLFENCHFSGSV